MQELLQLIIGLVEAVPELAIWVLVIIYGYKIVIAGTVYGCIRFVVSQICKCFNKPKEFSIQGYFIDEEVREAMLIQLARLGVDDGYIFRSHVDELRKAIDIIKTK